MHEVQKQQALAQTEIQIEQAKSQFEIQRMEQEAIIKKQLMAEEFQYQLTISSNGTRKRKLGEKEADLLKIVKIKELKYKQRQQSTND